MRRLLLGATALALGTVLAQANLLLNPTFQAGTGPGWFGNPGVVISNWTRWGNSGWYTDDFGATNLNVKIWWDDTGIYQDWSASPGSVYVVGADIMRSPMSGDQPVHWQAYVKAEFYNAANQQLLQYTVGTLGPSGPSGIWYQVSGLVTSPANTAYGRIVMGLQNYQSGAAGAYYFDNGLAEPSVIPEPATAMILALGFASLRALRKRG